LTAGLDYGQNSAEEEALRVIAPYSPPMVIINSLMPPPGRRLESHRLETVLDLAREVLPRHTKLGIGCMRPREIVITVDWLECYGISSIAMPSRTLVKELELAGIDYIRKEGCCALEALV
jgi:uncharacterized radical SAM superfamily protein